MTDIYMTPLLTARETAKHLRMPESTLNVWLSDTSGRTGPLVHSVPQARGWPRVPFVGVIEAYVLRGLRKAGISKADIRDGVDLVRQELQDEYALALKRFETDGVDLFVRRADLFVRRADLFVRRADHLTTLHGQYPIDEVLAPHLRDIHWGPEGEPRSLRLRSYPDSAEVVIDPRFAWGAPVLQESRVPVQSIVDLWRGGGESMDVIASEYGLTRRIVEDICRVAA